jgi:pimeloyl-ACP methyl ester carboxylesterase
MSALADRFHIISPGYPGFGNSDMPDRSKFAYMFDRLAEIVEGLLKQIRFTQFGLYIQDYGRPIGFRVINRHPDWLGMAYHIEHDSRKLGMGSVTHYGRIAPLRLKLPSLPPRA